MKNSLMVEKKFINDLAIFGGKPSFQEKLYTGRPNIINRERFLKYVQDILDRKILSNDGPLLQELEQKIANLLGVKHCLATSSGTLGLEIAIRASGLSGEVIVPAFTFIATAHALYWQKIKPVFCDIDPHTHNISPRSVKELITPQTTGIIGVHLWGRPCDITALTKIAEKHNLFILYDAAHALGCSYNGRMIGNYGNAEVLSFHSTKFYNTLEGGAVVTNDDELAMKVRMMRNFGFNGTDRVDSIGTNGKMNEISAAMGLTLMSSFDDLIKINYQNYKQYQRELKGVPGVKLIQYIETEQHNYQYIVLEVDESITIISRDILIDILNAENVVARRYFFPGCHLAEPYRSAFPVGLPETEKISHRIICLPNGNTINLEAIRLICHVIRFSIMNGVEIISRF